MYIVNIRRAGVVKGCINSCSVDVSMHKRFWSITCERMQVEARGFRDGKF